MKKFLLLFSILSFTSVSAQTKITSATFGMMEARHLGPGTMSGRITAIAGSDSDGKTIYIGSAGGGVWKTTNAGVSYRSMFDKYCQSIGAIAIDQKHSDVVYVGTGESNMRNTVSIGDGLYKSNDAGDNWTKIGLDSTEHISKIVIDPTNSDIIYVASPGPLYSDSKHRGLYKSIDAGKSWEKILYINDKTGCADIAIDPKHPETIYASTWEFRRTPYSFNSGGNGSGMYKSIDGGKSWKELTSGLPQKPFGRIAFALCPSAPNDLVAIIESKETGLYISRDGGDSWKQQSAAFNVTARPFYFSTIMFDPFDSTRVYRPAFNFAYSNDGGYSFADASNDGGWVHSDHHALWINPKNTNQLYLGTDGGVYISIDRGASWIFSQNLPVGQFYHVTVDHHDPYRIYGGLQDNGSWMSPSSGPGGIGNANWQAINGGDGFWVQPDPNDDDIAYAESQGGEVNKIHLQTGKGYGIKPQSAEDEKLRWNWNSPIVTGASNMKNLYIGSQYLYKSTNQGRDWSKISPDLTTNDKSKQKQDSSGGISVDNTSAENHCTIFTIAESPLDEKMIAVGTDDGNLQITLDGGKTWKNMAANIPASGIAKGAWISSIELSRFDKNTIFATFDNHMYGDMKTYLAKSTDMGKSWQMISNSEFTGYAHKIKQDLVNKDLLYLGTEMGIFSSLDGGANWFRMKNNIPWYAPVRDIQIEPKTNDLLLATHGRGIIVVDDITPMRYLTPEIANTDVYLFPMKPIPLTSGKFGGGGFPTTGGWEAGNSSSTYIPPIEYYLKERVNTGDVKIEILDAEGKLVQDIPAATRRKGINKVYWNLRMKPPKIAGGGTKIDYAGFLAPMVMPGGYSVKLKIGNKEYSENFTTVHDSSNKDFSYEDRKVQYDAAMTLYHLHEDLAKISDDVNEKMKLIKESIDSISDSKKKKFLEEYHSKLESFHWTLLASKQKSIFADEKKLREDITDVYGSIAGNEMRPSNLELDRIKVLQKRVENARKENEEMTGKYYASANTIISSIKGSAIR
jgi:photosystem II stability/assembly factor-like uncharacterized protein